MTSRAIHIVGHRATGKTTLGRAVAERLGLEFVDLDARIEQREGRPCAEIVAEDVTKFRRIERETLERLRRDTGVGARIVALGAGFHPVPEEGLVVWLQRAGWRGTAAAERAQIDPSRALAEEFRMMERQRDPRWRRSAHFRYRIPRGRKPERAARDLARQLRWLRMAGRDERFARTFLVPETDAVSRARRDVSLLECAGLELRSDLHALEEFDGLALDEGCLLASLRSPDSAWLRGAIDRGASIVDIDVGFLEEGVEAIQKSGAELEQLIVSSHPPNVDLDELQTLERRARGLERRFGSRIGTLVRKYAPAPQDWGKVRRARHAVEGLRERGATFTYLPQGERFAGVRPALARENATNYLGVGLEPETTALGLMEWLPHLRGEDPEAVEALIGNPVDHSQGDRWHRAAGEEKGRRPEYLKLRLGRDQSDEEVEQLLALLAELGVRGVSVTSPLKRRITRIDTVAVPADLPAANTLVSRRADIPDRAAGGCGEAAAWEARETDQRGMESALEEFEERGVGPGSVAIIGQGGVAPAVVRAVEVSDWDLRIHASARQGWPEGPAGSAAVTLVVNAAGDRESVYRHPPKSIAWLDLHYRDVRAPPRHVEVHRNGDRFFDAQARAQRRIWRSVESGNESIHIVERKGSSS